ncbi:hypothetical protein [Thermomonospora umbrina]|uniref:Lipoprotein n=1 Tax=Thermomonospora umbrina TaxID=111806 RepID=A0A3D9SR68_9ACTN|nr:hypothetical protein [Thermomonospora umbrina]REE98298.1 hypothetical protein DFJ69_3784 [Thermomonospora umbrina]
MVLRRSRRSRRSRRAGLAVVMLAGCVVVPSSHVLPTGPAGVDEETTQQLTAAARTMLERRTQALVQASSRARPLPAEVLGVRISPRLARAQQEALRRLETRNRAPVAGGPPFTAAHTRLKGATVTRDGDRFTLDATEYTEVRYATPGGGGAVTQRVRRRFEFATENGRLTLVGEWVIDPDASPINDPGRPLPSPPAPAPPVRATTPPPTPAPSTGDGASPAVSPSAPSPSPAPDVPEPTPAGEVTDISR